MNEKIKNSIDKIEPESGAKERMYQNILKNAAKAEKTKMSPAKAARIALPIAACVCVVILGVTRLMPGVVDNPGESTVLGGNPYVEVGDASAFAPLGISVDAPEDAEDRSYAIIDGEIAEVDFSLDRHSYSLRASKSGDFSGMNGETVSREPIENGGDAELVTLKVDGVGECRIVEWTSGDVNFALSNSDGAAGDELRAVFEKIK